MCGIVGMAGRLDHADKARLDNLLMVCSVRGKDSTGVVRVSSGGDASIIKQVGPPPELLGMKAYDNLTMYGSKAVIGHCRFATVGGISKMTSHPFQHGHISGVHNGTLRNWSRVLDDSRDFNVDSDCLYHNIAKHGVEAVIPMLEGAWALSWWDAEQQTLNFIRNNERPLWFAWSENLQKMVWASEYWMLDMLRGEGGKGMNLWKNEKGEFLFPLPPDTLRTFKISSTGTAGPDIFSMEAEKIIKGDSPKPAAVSSPFHGGRTQRPTPVVENQSSQEGDKKKDGVDTAEDKPTTPNSTTTSNSSGTSASSKPSSTRKPLLSLAINNSEVKSAESVLHYKPAKNADKAGRDLSYDQFHKKTGGVCGCCSEFFTEDEYNEKPVIADWWTDDSFICVNCIGMHQYMTGAYS